MIPDPGGPWGAEDVARAAGISRQTLDRWRNEGLVEPSSQTTGGHYRYDRRMFSHFMQRELPAVECGFFLAGDEVSWTPGWAEGAVQTALNAVWGMVHHLGGECAYHNPGPGDRFDELKPLQLPD